MLGRKRLKERIKNPTTLGVNLMAKVTYRGVKYDTAKPKQSTCNKSDLTYRGVKFKKELCTAQTLTYSKLIPDYIL